MVVLVEICRINSGQDMTSHVSRILESICVAYFTVLKTFFIAKLKMIHEIER